MVHNPNMQVDYPNLKISKNGWFSYRRRIPQGMQWLYDDRTEYKVSFKTKSKNEAIKKWHEEERRWESTKALALNHDRSSLAELEQLAEVMRQSWSMTDSDLESMSDQQRGDVEVEASSVLQDLLLDEGQRDEDYKAGPKQTSPSRPIGRDARELALAGIAGLSHLKPAAAFIDVLDFYLKEVAPTKRDEVTRVRFMSATKSIFDKVGGLLPLGLATDVITLASSDSDRERLRLGVRRLWANGSTRRRNLVAMKAAIKKWNEFHQEQLPENLFNGYVSKDEITEDSKERRSFTPEEYDLFFANVASNISDEEVSLFLGLMAETGARNNEVTSLELKDVKPNAEPPHVIFRGNKIRGLSKHGLERAVPISKETAARLVRFVGSDSSRSPLFPKYSDQSKGSKLSDLCSSQIVNLRTDDERLLSPYSLRHTFTDKLRKVGAREDIAQYIIGHKTDGSSRVHDRYGTAVPPKELAKTVAKARETKEWGYFEQPDW